MRSGSSLVRAMGHIVLASLVGAVAVRGQPIAEVEDTSGGRFKLSSFAVSLSKGDDFQYRAWMMTHAVHRGHLLYDYPGTLPIRQADGVISFVDIDRIQSIGSEGPRMSVALLSGDGIVGTPLSGAKITGKTSLGEVTVLLRNVRALTVDASAAARAMAEEEESFRRKYSNLVESGWPREFGALAAVTRRGGGQLALTDLAFIYEISFSDCDNNYVPCKPVSYTKWKLTDKLPVLVGTAEVEVEFAKVAAFSFLPAGDRDRASRRREGYGEVQGQGEAGGLPRPDELRRRACAGRECEDDLLRAVSPRGAATW